MVSGDPTGDPAPRLPEDSCVNEAHYAAHEYMVLCTVLGTRVTDQMTLCTIIHSSSYKAHIKAITVFSFTTDIKKLK